MRAARPAVMCLAALTLSLPAGAAVAHEVASTSVMRIRAAAAIGSLEARLAARGEAAVTRSFPSALMFQRPGLPPREAAAIQRAGGEALARRRGL